jgi:isopentenyl diphosphate isomerase/L-lactate dehydrogenase-like FMN-dependent dehydrogenase
MTYLSYNPKYPAISDLKAKAKKRIPNFAYDYVDGGIDQEHGKQRNRDAWHTINLVPQYLKDVGEADLNTSIFGKDYAMPFGVPPIGLGNMMWPGAELALATAAQKANMPYILSTFSTTKLEDIAKAAPDVCWFQLYVPKKITVMKDLLTKVKDAGYNALVVTLDIPVGAKRNRELKNGLKLPFSFTPKIIWQCATHPTWALRMLVEGQPDFVNVMQYNEGPNEGLSNFITQFNMHGVTRERIELIRDLWDGPLVLKGVQHEPDMIAAKEIGVDGVIVSNHGGRQLDAAPSTVESLEKLAHHADDNMTIMVDSGIRTGTDVVRAKALGAKMSFSGRSFFWGMGALGTTGAEQVIGIYQDEIDRTLKQVGCRSISEMDETWL